MKKIQCKSDKMLFVENKTNENIEELLRKMYVDQNMDIYAMCQELGISYVTTLRWLEKAGIYSRRLNTLL